MIAASKCLNSDLRAPIRYETDSIEEKWIGLEIIKLVFGRIKVFLFIFSSISISPVADTKWCEAKLIAFLRASSEQIPAPVSEPYFLAADK